MSKYHLPIIEGVHFVIRKYHYLSVGMLFSPVFYSIVYMVAIGIASLNYYTAGKQFAEPAVHLPLTEIIG